VALHCPECGFVNTDGANYCQKCGAFLGDLQQATESSTATYRIDETTGERSLLVADEDFFDYHYGRTFGYPLPSPRGDCVLFRSHRSGWINYWAASLTEVGAELRALVPAEADQSEARWSPDGSRLAYIENHNGTLELRVLEVGRGRIAILDGGEDCACGREACGAAPASSAGAAESAAGAAGASAICSVARSLRASIAATMGVAGALFAGLSLAAAGCSTCAAAGAGATDAGTLPGAFSETAGAITLAGGRSVLWARSTVGYSIWRAGRA